MRRDQKQQPMRSVTDPHQKGCVCTACVGAKRAKASGKGARATADASARAPHPTAKPGGTPPLNKMGVTSMDCEPSPGLETVQLVMTDDGEVKPILVRRAAAGSIAHVDWVNFTIGEETWVNTSGAMLVADDDYIREASSHFEQIFGFGITEHMGRGRNFYHDSWVLGQKWGFVCFGGQRGTMLVMLSGQGCLHAREGWEKRLYEFLITTAERPKMTRIDLAHDDFEGRYISVDWADQQDQVRGFCCSSFGEPPTVEHKGAWRRPSGKGRTLTVGLRDSGKYARFYEKGKKEGDKSSTWCRAEVEFKSTDRFIPFEVLLTPSDYFLAAYPCFSVFESERNPQRIEIKKKTAEIVFQSAIEITNHQFGKYIRAFRDVIGDDTKVLDLICADEGQWPKRLLRASESIETCPPALHHAGQLEPLTMDQFEASVCGVLGCSANH